MQTPFHPSLREVLSQPIGERGRATKAADVERVRSAASGSSSWAFRSRQSAVQALLPLALALQACSGAPVRGTLSLDDQQTAPPALLASRTIQPAEIRGAVRLLSSDAFEGRGVGSRGDTVTRAYIAAEFERLGLSVMGDDGSFTQSVPILGLTTTIESQLVATGKAGEARMQAPADYTAVAGSPAAQARWQDAEIVFCGYGIKAEAQQWDDWKEQDVRGKVVLVMNDDPSSDPSLFAGTTRLYYGRWTYKFEEAARRGAVGVLLIHTNQSAGYPFHVQQASHGRENFWLAFRDGEPTLPIRSWIAEDKARQLCALGGLDLDALRAVAQTRDFRPVPLGVQVSLAASTKTRELRSGNVLGMLKGSDPSRAHETIVVTAHFDHLGIGTEKRGDSIYNGALDNATGIAALLAIARICSEMNPRPARSILFSAVTAEESGLLGSQWLARNLPIDRKTTIANFNIDGLGIWGETSDIEIVGFGKNSLTQVAERIGLAMGLRVRPDSNPDLGLFYRSDHFNFARIGVPAAYFKSGSDFKDRPDDRKRMKASYTATHYHQPSDEVADWWNFEAAAKDAQFVLECLLACSQGDAPTWTRGDEFEALR